MKKTNNNKKQSGLTLIEVLAALVILGIVFIGIMSVFPQMTLFNEKTGLKLNTMNLARQEMTTFTTNSAYTYEFPIERENLKLFVEEKLETQFPSESIAEVAPLNDDSLDYSLKKDEVDYHFQISEIPDLGSGTSAEITLFRVILNVKSGPNTPESKTYGYLEIK